MSLLILAHRGASGYAPENTLAAFDLALELGAPGIETDVRLTRDGVLLLLHDERVDRTTDGSGLVADLTWSVIEQLDAGRWFSAETAGQRVPRLDAFLDRFLGQATLCLEVKAAEAVEPLVHTLAARGLGGRADVQLTSFSWETACRLHETLPGLAVGYLTPRFDEDEIERVATAGLAQICPRAGVLDAALVARAHERGLQVRAWGVATRADLARVAAAGADGTTLNWPDWAIPTGGRRAHGSPSGT